MGAIEYTLRASINFLGQLLPDCELLMPDSLAKFGYIQIFMGFFDIPVLWQTVAHRTSPQEQRQLIDPLQQVEMNCRFNSYAQQSFNRCHFQDYMRKKSKHELLYS